jgi:hypothetical protein
MYFNFQSGIPVSVTKVTVDMLLGVSVNIRADIRTFTVESQRPVFRKYIFF